MFSTLHRPRLGAAVIFGLMLLGAREAAGLSGIGADVSPQARASITVRVHRDGTCEAAVNGAERAAQARNPDRGARQAAPTDFVCALPAVRAGSGVDLVVALPPGVEPSGADFPRLTWREDGGVWIGAAALPAAPAFVRVAGPDSRLPRRARWLDAIALAATVLAILVTILYSARAADARGAVRP